jgi:ubiquinone/menaquinone biosynthesis C-methylase UbiE
VPIFPVNVGAPGAKGVAEVFGRACASYDSVIPYFATFGRRLVERARVDAGEDVLDVACGRGASLLPAAAAVGPTGSVTGVDLSTEMVAALTTDPEVLAQPRVSVWEMDGEALDFPDCSFDVVLCGFGIQLMPRPRTVAAGFLRVLRPGGRVALSAPNETSPGWGFILPLIGRYAGRATRPMPPLGGPDPDFAAIYQAAGFEDVTVTEEVAHFVMEDEDAWWRWAWSVGLRAFLEPLPPDALGELRTDVFAHLRTLVRSDGLHLEHRARFLLGRRPR